MFKLLRRKFNSVLLVIAILLCVIMVLTYFVIEKALVSDYTNKTNDVARKITKDLQIKTDYVEYISLFFIDKIMEKADNYGNVAEYDFNNDVSKIKIYNSDIDGLGIFWDSGKSFLTNSLYFQYIPDAVEKLKGVDRNVWVAVNDEHNKSSYLFLLIPIQNPKNSQKGIVAVEATSLKKILKTDNLFLNDADIYFETAGDRFALLGSERSVVKTKHNLCIDEKVQDSLKLVLNFPMKGLNEQLNSVKFYMILFSILFLILAAAVVRRMINKIVNELEILKKEIDDYASSK